MRSHLDALETRLSHERVRLASAKGSIEIGLRAVWIAQTKKEIAIEKAHLGIIDAVEADMSEDELLAALSE